MHHLRLYPLFLLVVSLIVLPGCVPVALTGAAIIAGVGVDHTLNGIVYKTFTAPVDELEVATVHTLKRMDINIIEKQKSETGWDIKATAMGRNIDIDLESLTSNTTRMRVVASQNRFFLKDSATATEIIVQTANTLG